MGFITYICIKIIKMGKKGRESRYFIDRTGEIHINKQGCKITIIGCDGAFNCTIQFDDGRIYKNIRYDHIKEGNVKNYYYPSVLNKGYMGIGEYNSKNSKKAYTCWGNILSRCYDEKERHKFPTYENVNICAEWECFQDFAKWHKEHYREGFDLDKDIIVKGSTVYSPKTCDFAPQQINKLFTSRKEHRGKYPIGVSITANGRFKAGISRGKKRVDDLGIYDTSEEAFNAYKIAKEIWIKEVADYWKPLISERLYKAMYNWIVEITD